ncbi:MAG: alkaline phosphatase family protein [Mucilaginibacter sp.]|nr:alkaline phosphatase family protein [Mucilaginibacter sp.]
MIRLYKIVLGCLFWGICLNTRAQVKHVILLSIDGLHPDMYLDPTWPAPNLRQLMKDGTYADHCLSVFPSYTYPSHTSMITGALPARSGINFNQPIGSKGDWFWFTKAVKVPTLWQVLKTNGMTTAAVQWPVSVTGDITWNFPEIWNNDDPDDRVTESRKYATPGLIEDIERNATGKLDNTNFNDNYFSLDENAGRAAAYIFQSRRPTFMAVHFAEVDGKEHDDGRDADSVRLALATVDHAIGDLMEAINKSGLMANTAIIIVGDHGFATVNQVMRVNMLIKNLPVRFIASGGSAFLYHIRSAVNMDDPGIIKAVTDSLNQLPKGKRELFQIVYRKELDKMGADSAALLAVTAKPGLVFSGAGAAKQSENHGPGTLIQNNKIEGLFLPAIGGHHGYDPNIPDMYTGFIAYGAGVIKGGHIKRISEPDVAVLVAKLLNIDFPTADGKSIDGILKSN